MSEIRQGLHLNTAILNDLSGGGRIKANLMRQNEIEFTIQAKFIIVGNHRPRLPASRDDGIYDRLRLLELSTKPDSKDPHLLDKLKTERPAILHTLVQYSTKILTNNEELPTTPAVMRESAAEFSDQQDHFYHDVIDLVIRHRELAAHGLFWVSELYSEFKDECPLSPMCKSKTYFTKKLMESFKGLVSGRKKRTINGRRTNDRTLDIRTLVPDDNETDDTTDEPPF